MDILTDSRNNRYVEADLDIGQKVRITHIAESWSGKSGLRIQIRDEAGHLRQGLEIPGDKVGDVVVGIAHLIRS